MGRSLIFPAVLALLLAPALAAHAQVEPNPAPAGPPDVVRGRVSNDSAGPLGGATVIVTRGPDRLVQQTTTDSDGRYSLTFDPGTGDYLVYVSLHPYRPARRRVQRQATERELVADFVLAVDATVLAAVNVTATVPARASNEVRPTVLETGSSERWADGVEGQLPPSVAGDLGALAGTIPGVTIAGGVPSILGSGAESNLTTLNGMGMGAAQIPRAARTETRVTGATFDVTRGGFSGANIDVRLGPGSRSYQRRNAFLTLDPPQLQTSDRVGRSLGARSGGFRGSVGADGELIRQALTYNVALDLSRTTSDVATLFGANRETLEGAGVSPDSVFRLAAVAGTLGLSASPVGGGRQRTSATWLGRLDDTRDTLSTRALTSYVAFSRDESVGSGPLIAQSSGGMREEATYGAQLTFGTFTGPARRILTETRLAAGRSSLRSHPYSQLPAAAVLIRSTNEAAGVPNVSRLSLGGAPFAAGDESRWTLEGANETVWNARGRRHRFKALAWGRADGLEQVGTANAQGNFVFNSLADFEASRPASFTRTLESPSRDGRVWNAAGALAHQWLPSRWFNVIYGARLEGNGFLDRPSRNTALEEALGIPTGLAPTRFHVSPRLGFTYTYNRDRDNGSGMTISNIGKFYRHTTGVVRGGVGEFRDLLRPGVLADAMSSTGLPGATSSLSCVGEAVPTPDWTLFASDPTAIPTSCADGGGILVERAPSVMLIGKDHDVPRSWRASLDWSTNVGKWLFRAGALGSLDLAQPGITDANFAGVQRFSLPGEGDRPVFVSAGSIDPRTGALSPAEARIASEFSRVAVRTSDLRGYGTQLTLGLAPDIFKFRNRYSLFVGSSYTLQQSRRQFRGFDGAAFGDPREREWAPSAADARHIVVLSGGIAHAKIGTLTMFGRAQSGLPFTPVVQGDVNGDGRGGDRAFIPHLEDASAELRAGLLSLLEEGSPAARTCLQRYAGREAVRNGCRGPWTHTLNAQWRPPIPRRWLGRVTANVYLQNILGGIDQLLHGAADMRGWGAQAAPDPVLLVPKSFDVATRSFSYDVNPRFADMRPGRTTVRAPFRMSIDFSVDLSVPFELQQLRRALEPVRAPAGGWERRGADSITAFYLRNTSSIHKMLMAESDSLFLSGAQYDRLRVADSIYSAEVRAVFLPLGEFLAATGGRTPGKMEIDSVQASLKAYWSIFWRQPEIADSLITPSQRALVPMLQNMLGFPQRDRPNSRWMFGYPVSMQVNATPPRPRPR
jgi:hypothetical protein